ncbi:MAG: hypothetical protein AAGF85_00675 [Bacteroidota bacterium]
MIVNLKEALSIIHGTHAFDVEFVTADKRRNTGGEVKVLKGCQPLPKKPGDPLATKRRNNYINATRTITPAEGHPVSVHIFLITKINGREVSLY